MLTAQAMSAMSCAISALDVVPLGVDTTVELSHSGAPLCTRF